jgi:hypothetical protein
MFALFKILVAGLAICSGGGRLTEAKSTSLSGTVRVFTSHKKVRTPGTSPALSNERTFYSLTPPPTSGVQKQKALLFSLGSATSGADVASGDRVTLTYDVVNASRRNLLQAGDPYPTVFVRNLTIDAPGEGGKQFVINGIPVDIKGVVMLVTNMCGTRAPLSISTLRAKLFGPMSSRVTLQGHYETCTFNKVRYDPSKVLVTEVSLPCKGTGSQGAWDASKCGGPEIYGWAETAMAQAQKALKIGDWKAYPSRTLILPKRTACGWAGLAQVGCDPDCLEWLNSYDSYHDLNAHIHEQGHNIGFNHANRWNKGKSDEYGDFSDPMGSTWAGLDATQAKTFVCMNAPGSFKAGWASAAWNFTLSKSSSPKQRQLAPGLFQRVTLPSMHLTDKNFLYLKVGSLAPFAPSWPRGAAPLPRANQLFVSYRVRQLSGSYYDSGLLADSDRRLWVHSYNTTYSVRPDPSDLALRPNLVAVLAFPGQSSGVLGGRIATSPEFRQNYGSVQGLSPGVNGVVIRAISANSTHGVFDIGYFKSLRESDCNNGLDDDLDGLVDGKDPDCK